jgi:hypothetical protein
MQTTSIEQLYERHIKPLPSHEQLKLVALIARKMARNRDATKHPNAALWNCTALAPKFGKESTHRNMSINCAKNGIIGHDKA